VTEELRDPMGQIERERYARHLSLPDIGPAGQERLRAARVLIVGLGGLGSPVALYLAAAGVGTIGLVDADTVTRSNLQRQVIHDETQIGRPKVASAEHRIRTLNPDVRVETFAEQFTEDRALAIAEGYALIVDGVDNFATRYMMNTACLELGIPYIYGAVSRFEGQASVFCTPDAPCYRCLFPQSPPSDAARATEQEGILGSVPGTIGTLQATEVVKHIVGFGTSLAGRLLIYDARSMSLETVPVKRNPSCPACAAANRE